MPSKPKIPQKEKRMPKRRSRENLKICKAKKELDDEKQCNSINSGPKKEQ
jgi:hypothetical protein